MSKRMTDTGKWDKKWFRELPPSYKLFWQYIIDKCDLAGFWDIDFKTASYFIGSTINDKKARELFNSQIYEVNCKYWLIVDFIKFQNGWPLNEKSPVHKKIIELLNSKGIDIIDNTLYDRVCDRVCHTQIVKVIVKEEVKVEVKEGVKSEVLPKKQQPPIQLSDLTDELKIENPHLYRLGKMLIENCPDLMAMDNPMSFLQLKELVKKYGADPVEKILKSMQNKGIGYLRKKDCHYTFLTVESWIKI